MTYTDRIALYRLCIADMIAACQTDLNLPAGHAIPMYLNAVLLELDRLKKEAKP